MAKTKKHTSHTFVKVSTEEVEVFTGRQTSTRKLTKYACDCGLIEEFYREADYTSFMPIKYKSLVQFESSFQ